MQEVLSLFPYKVMGKTPQQLLQEFGLGGLTGRTVIETDPHILDQLDLKKFAPNDLTVEKDAKLDAVMFQMLHQYNLTGTLLYSFKEKEDDDITVFPV